ncbi:MAG: hypothetical protein N0E44_18225 [Candidatus Thiodiazotropha lotti]|nr:hypothetical protein [Candidatus Thiodiazotropha lotti]MCW4221821.1 hypothetical protein [Candidatus Thiodiazotropha lotti]
MKLRGLPAAQDIQRGESNAIKSLLSAIAELQKKAAMLDDLVDAGIVAVNPKGRVYDPSEEDESDFTDSINVKPDAPTGLSVRTSANLAFLSWDIPKFQPRLAYAEVWELAAPLFQDNVDYVIGEFTTYEGVVYRFTSDHPAAAWDVGDVSVAVAGDLVIGNTNNRHQSAISTAIAPLDVNGGTSYFWVRLVTYDGVAGLFSSSIGVHAQTSDLDAGGIDVVALRRTSDVTTGAGDTIIAFTDGVTVREINEAPLAVLTGSGTGEVTIPDDQGYTQFRLTAYLRTTGNGAGSYRLYFRRNGATDHDKSLGNSINNNSAMYGGKSLSFITPWMDITSGGDIIYLMLEAPTGQSVSASYGIGLQVELK